MDTAKKESASKEAPVAPAANGPIKVFLIDEVSGSVFARDIKVSGGTRTFYSVSFSRSYLDSNGVRKYVKTFNPEDLEKVARVAQQADDHIRTLAQPA